jgi:hypothetical protein
MKNKKVGSRMAKETAGSQFLYFFIFVALV